MLYASRVLGPIGWYNIGCSWQVKVNEQYSSWLLPFSLTKICIAKSHKTEWRHNSHGKCINAVNSTIFFPTNYINYTFCFVVFWLIWLNVNLHHSNGNSNPIVQTQNIIQMYAQVRVRTHKIPFVFTCVYQT